MSLRELGLLVYSEGFAVSPDEYIVREPLFCDWTGHHHVLFKYTLPLGLTYDLLSADAKTRVDRQTKMVHGLPFEPFLSDHNRHEFYLYCQLRDDVTRWCQQYFTPERWRVCVFIVNGRYRLFQEPRFSYLIVVLEGQGCRELSSVPIATVNVMATNDHGQNWSHDHLHGERGIWHEGCAQVRACQMSGWLPRDSNVLPTLSQVNAQCVLWQKQCDRPLDEVLCNHCHEGTQMAFTLSAIPRRDVFFAGS